MALARRRRRRRTGDKFLTILSVAYPFAPVSLDTTGGAEQILALLDRGLCAEGHRSLVLASADSHVSGELIGVPVANGPIDESLRRDVHDAWRQAIAATLRTHSIDLIHFHGVDFHRYLPVEEVPVLATLHLPPTFYPESIFHCARPRTWLNCVSASERRSCPGSPLLVEEIENGISPELFDVPLQPVSDYVLALGRICPEKGFHLALDAAHQAGIPLFLAGKVFPYPDHIGFWREQLEPRLHAPHRYLGPIGMLEKARILAGARCVLIPSLVPETSSLVAMEALERGTPVVAFLSGALAEIVEDGRTGFLVSDTAQMARAIAAVNHLRRGDCRAAARSRFSAQTMVAKYIRLYSRLIGSRDAGEAMASHGHGGFVE